MTNDVNDYLFGGGSKAFQFNELNDICHGTVISAELRQQTSIEGEPLTWADGTPRKQLVIVVQTEARDDDDDDGQRALYAKGGNFEIATGDGTSMRNAIADAMKAVGAKSLDPGDELWVGYTGIGKGRRGYSPPKLYSAKFRKASQGVSAADLFGDRSAAQPQPQASPFPPTPIDTGV